MSFKSVLRCFSGGSDGKESAYNAGDPGSVTVSLLAEFHGQEPGRL